MLVPPKHLAPSLLAIIGEGDLLKADNCVYRRVVNQSKVKLLNGRDALKIGPDAVEDGAVIPSDMENQLQFKPTEALAEMVTLLLGYLCVDDVEAAKDELLYLQLMRESPHLVIWHPDLDEAYNFVIRIFQGLVNWKANEATAEAARISTEEEFPGVQDLSSKTQLVLKVVQTYLFGNFRYRLTQRFDALQHAVAECSTRAEWLVALADLVRRKRRDTPKYLRVKRGGGGEEHPHVDKALKLEDQNPFVKLALLDSIVDCLRDSRKSFTCGDVTFDTNDNDTITFFKETCRDVLKEFPRSVKLHSQISDYFARFVTLCFFDVPYAEECLELAYKLNPTYAPTTHRYGIFNRMSKGELSISFEWFKQTEKLDSYHYNAFIECIKNMIGLPGEYNPIAIIEEKLWTPGACSWTDPEMLELLFYKGIAHFIQNEMEEALDAWALVALYYQPFFCLSDLDQTCGFYNWDQEMISSDKLRVWMHTEQSKEDQPPKRKKLVTLIYKLMIGDFEPKKPSYSNSPLTCARVFGYFKSQQDHL